MKAIVPTLALGSALALQLACSPAPAPDAPTAGVTSGRDAAERTSGQDAAERTSGQDAASPASPPTGEAPSSAPDAAPSVKITEVSGEPGKTAYMKVTAVFANPNTRPCRISRYTLEWPGSAKEIKLDDFVIPAKETRQRSVKVHPEDGDLTKLSMESARLVLPAKCEAP